MCPPLSVMPGLDPGIHALRQMHVALHNVLVDQHLQALVAGVLVDIEGLAVGEHLTTQSVASALLRRCGFTLAGFLTCRRLLCGSRSERHGLCTNIFFCQLLMHLAN